MLSQLLLEGIHLGFMGKSDFLELIVGPSQIVIVLLGQPLDCLVQLKLVLSLNRKDFILQLSNQLLKALLGLLVVLQLAFIASQQELDLLVFLLESRVEVFDLLHHGVLNQTSQLSDISESVFSLSDDIVSGFASLVFVLTVSFSQLVSETSHQSL